MIHAYNLYDTITIIQVPSYMYACYYVMYIKCTYSECKCLKYYFIIDGGNNGTIINETMNKDYH